MDFLLKNVTSGKTEYTRYSPSSNDSTATHLIIFIHTRGLHHAGSWPLLDACQVVRLALRCWHGWQRSPPLLGCLWRQRVWDVWLGNGVGPCKSWAVFIYQRGGRGTCSLREELRGNNYMWFEDYKTQFETGFEDSCKCFRREYLLALVSSCCVGKNWKTPYFPSPSWSPGFVVFGRTLK